MFLYPFQGGLGDVPALFNVEESQEELLAIGRSGFMTPDDRLEEVNHGLRLLSEGGVLILPVQEISSGEGLIDEDAPASLNLTVLIIIEGPRVSRKGNEVLPPDWRHLGPGFSRAVGGQDRRWWRINRGWRE